MEEWGDEWFGWPVLPTFWLLLVELEGHSFVRGGGGGRERWKVNQVSGTEGGRYEGRVNVKEGVIGQKIGTKSECI